MSVDPAPPPRRAEPPRPVVDQLRPAGGLLHPAVLIALAVLLLNDHVLKAAWPGPMTWILSDVAGLIVAPLAVQAAWELGSWLAGQWAGPRRDVLAASVGLVAAGFVALQLWPPATDAYRMGLGLAQWPFLAALALTQGLPVPAPTQVVAVGDAADLLALPALAVTWWLGQSRLAAVRHAAAR
jgi:hypothetical protein